MIPEWLLTTGIQSQRDKKELKSGVMARLTPESILVEIWYGSHGLHLIGAPICIKIDSVALSQHCKALNQLF
jgi:hypothetical protein